MGIIERVLCAAFDREDITDSEGVIYLRRWYIFPRNPKSNNTRRIYLHKFYRSDKDRHLHDHPFAYRSLILKGGYWEHSFNPAYSRWVAKKRAGLASGPWPWATTLRKWYGPGSFLKRGASWAHKVELRDGKKCWTLVLTDKKSRSWGFHADLGWCHWKNYANGVCWCYDKPEEQVGG